MTKTYIYNVAGMEWESEVPFGEAWKAAQVAAAETKAPIYRRVIIHEERTEVFCNGGIFLNAEGLSPDKVKIF